MHMFVQVAASKSGFIELVQVYFRREQYLFLFTAVWVCTESPPGLEEDKAYRGI